MYLNTTFVRGGRHGFTLDVSRPEKLLDEAGEQGGSKGSIVTRQVWRILSSGLGLGLESVHQFNKLSLTPSITRTYEEHQ